MHGKETRLKAKECLEQGMTKTAMARQLGVDRRTIHRWIEGGKLGQGLEAKAEYGPRQPKAHKLDAYKGIIEARLAEYPKLSAMRLYDEIRKAGYQGGYGRVRDHVREIRPREMEEEAVRFETPPGRQGQVDFASFGMAWGRRHALVVVLGFSRLLWLRFNRRQTMETLFDGLESAFGYFGGVPREMLFDQMRSVVVSDRRTDGGRLTLNEEFCASRRTGDLRHDRAAPTVPRPRARWSGRSATCARASATDANSSTTRTSTSRRPTGWKTLRTCGCTGRPGSALQTVSSEPSGMPCIPWL